MRTLLIPLSLLFATGCPFINDAYVDEHFAALDGDGDGVLESEGDCDDTNAAINPAATDICDGIDNDCDGDVDEDPQEALFVDADGDGFGAGTPIPACAGEGFSELSTDCDDGDALVNPDANEVCNDIDDDCDGTPDNTDNSWYADVDGDTFGDFDTASDVCQPGYVSDATDCDDNDGTINPGADELCDGIDQDCDSVPDNDPVDPDTFYGDADADGYGDTASPTEACVRPAGHAEVDGDCDDADADVYPDAEELCDDKDNDCDGDIDETPPTWYADTDNDGHGDASVTSQGCEPPASTGWSAKSDDCNDSDDQIYPLAPELCDDVDNDCDVEIDEDAVDQPTWYLDGDNDDYGASSPTQIACDQPDGYVDNSDDCNDGEADVNPETVWYADTDGDQFGDPSGATMTQCQQPAGFVRDATDCNDNDAAQNPATVWYPDSDGDDYGEMGGTTMVQCEQPANHVMDNTDCNDGDAAINPESSWWDDDDDDGYGDEADLSPIVQCQQPPLTSLDRTDCDDSDELTNPGVTPACDTIDRNCDGGADNDFDGDGFARAACPGGYDCDDSLASANLTPSGKNNGACSGLYSDCTALQDDFPNVEDGMYWLVSSVDASEAQYFCDQSTDGGGWTLVATLDAGDQSECSTMFDDAAVVVFGMSAGGDLLSKVYGDNDVTQAPESVFKVTLGTAPLTTLSDFFDFDIAAGWEVSASTNYSVTDVLGTSSYGTELYWNFGPDSTKKNYCIGGDELSGNEQVCIETGGACGSIIQGGAAYDGTGGSTPFHTHEDRTHELYVRAP